MTAARAMAGLLAQTADPAWVLVVDGYEPMLEASIESRFAISNGLLGVRGARSVSRGDRWVIPAHTYVAGLFDNASAGQVAETLVPAADWLGIRLLLPSGPLLAHPGDVLSHRMTLDMKRGALISESRRLHAPNVALHFRTLRLVSMHNRAVGLQLIQLEVEHGAVEVTLEACSEGTELGLTTDLLEQELGVWRTRHSGKRLAMAMRPSLRIDGQTAEPIAVGPLRWSWSWQTRPGQIVDFDRLVAIVRTDQPDRDPGPAARDKLEPARHAGYCSVVRAHEEAWATRWSYSDVTIVGDAEAQQALRFAVYHLNSAANPADERVSIGARALTGDDYHGHVFWDTEIFLLPFYSLTWPEAARSLLMYRFHTLDGARAKAAGMGWRGALYAWESADTGAEMTPDQVVGPDLKIVAVLCGRQEQHISADIAYAVWQYWKATGDDDFMQQAGAEILLETGRVWASRATLEADGYRHIRTVIGPDEYHEHIDDNAYTNVLARWNIRRAMDVAAWLRGHWAARWTALASRLGLTDAELSQWLTVADTMATGFDAATGLFEQFSGYFKLEQIDLEDYAGRTVPMDVVLGRVRTQNSQVVKQADVVALLALLPDEFDAEMADNNFRYYALRCCHGSSLSPSMHGLVAARLGDTETALRFFRQTSAIDLSNTHLGSAGGIHIAALGGIWMLSVFGFAGVSLRDDGLAIDPHLPPGWQSIAFTVQWRGRVVKVGIDQAAHRIEATLEAGEPMTLFAGEKPHHLAPGAAGLTISW
jgi:trehalose/maltose hydrolase-like predicted phosphorylase